MSTTKQRAFAALVLAGCAGLALAGCPAPGASNNTNGTGNTNAQTVEGVTTLKEGNAPGPIDISTYGGKSILIYGNNTSNTVVLYDMNEKKLLKKLTIGSAPTDMVLRADGRYAYITCKGSEQVAIVDVANLSAEMVKVGYKRLDANNATASNPVHIFAVDAPADAADYTSDTVQTFATKTTVAVGDGPHGIAFAGGNILNANPSGFSLSVIDPSTEAVTSTKDYAAETPKGKPSYTKAAHDGRYAINLDGGAKAVRVIDGQTGETVKKIDLQGSAPGSKCYWQDDTTLVLPVTDATRKENVVRLKWSNGFTGEPTFERLKVVSETATDSVGGFAAIGGGFLAVPHKNDNSVSFAKLDGLASQYRVAHEGHENSKQQIWIGGDGDATVTVLDAQTNKVIGVVKVGNGHHKMAFTPTKAFVSNITDDSVSVIDRTLIK